MHDRSGPILTDELSKLDEIIDKRILDWEGKLNDISARNPLIQFGYNRTRIQLETMDLDDSLELFQDLGSKYTICVTRNIPPEKTYDVSPVYTENYQPDDDASLAVQATFAETAKEGKLWCAYKTPNSGLNLYRTTTEDHNDRALNTLFLSIGLLEWEDPIKTGTYYKSPLLLRPVKLIRTSATQPLSIVALEEDSPIINPTLLNKLKQYIEQPLDSYWSGESQDGKDSIQRLKGLLSGQDNPIRYKITSCSFIARFMFQRAVIYEDIRHHKALIKKHPFIRSLVAEKGTTDELITVKDIDQADLVEDFNVLDADLVN